MAVKQTTLINKLIKKWAASYKKGKYTKTYRSGTINEDYEELYKDIVQYGEPYLNSYTIEQLIEAALVEGDFKSHYNRIFTNFSNHNWIYIEALQEDKRSVFERIKVYISPTKETTSAIFLSILKDLWGQKFDFCAKLALIEREDKIILWVFPKDLDTIIERVLPICETHLLEPPLLLPRYKGFGISRELDISYNEFIAKTLFDYIRLPNRDAAQTLDLKGYIGFIESKPKVVQSYDVFDRTVALNSLLMIRDNKSPLDLELGIVYIKKRG